MLVDNVSAHKIIFLNADKSFYQKNGRFKSSNFSSDCLQQEYSRECMYEQMSDVLGLALINANKEIEQCRAKIVPIEELKSIKRAKTVLEIGKSEIDKVLLEKYKNNSEISFANSKIHKKRMRRNHLIIHGCAISAAGAAYALAQTPGGDEAALTTLTTGLAAGLCVNYNNAPVSVFAPMAAQILGKLLGETTLKYIIKWIPGAGNAGMRHW